MRWILYILIFLALLVLAGFMFPREVTLERSVYITKPPQAVFPYVNNFRNFNDWSPWYQLDPNTQYEYSGPKEGLGAVMSWSSDNPNVGSGSQTITASEPDSLVRTDLDFGAQGVATAEFRLQPQGSGTNITWWFSSDMGGGPIARWMGLLVKKMVGGSYEQGLAKLKNLVESDTASPQPSEDIDNGSDDDLPGDVDDEMGAEPEGIESEMDNQTLEEEGEEVIEEDQ
ncbi:Polyketide cyclase / dehydrase and lipid transport [Microbulbifer donghaiensis]|uniref:Polyketide cyclase / dehydrase and lipid transport n=1 Tax=Microbulbifer donghaiensis TaxID=494016 RepID=A0A1M4WXT1_9GAMM|nr:SRPBCC family protein [Microbulbifer donghaiensis]SHE85772.1 Polyketide cyclase / dehydrase and lipid transport [Microbulbifer donghaiensis]